MCDVKFCTDQLRMAGASASGRRYTSETLKLAFTLFTRSPTCYRMLLDSDCVILPHPSNLRKFS